MRSTPSSAPVPSYTSEQIRAAEAPLLAAGVPLMQRAARGLADEIEAVLKETRIDVDVPAAVVVLVGSGDNGGDALFAAAHLARAGVDVVVASTSSRMHPGGADAARSAGAVFLDGGPLTGAEIGALVNVDPFADADHAVRASLAAADLIVDGIVGIGGSGALRGRARDLVRLVLEVTPRPMIVAVDVPSGIDADTGAVPDATVLPADVTVTFGAVKVGLLLAPASDYVGRIRVIDIGLDLGDGRIRRTTDPANDSFAARPDR